MTSEEMFNKIIEKIDNLPCRDHGEAISRMQGEKSGANSVKQEVIQKKALSYKMVSIIIVIAIGVFRAVDMIIERL